MKKLLLVFMSMFFVLGTSMAQDEAFGVKAVTPSSDKPVTRVDNVTLVFTKDITATMPEGGIEVVNTETKESIKLASIYENPYMDKNIVMFEFEKKMVPGKDGKEELQSLYIDTPGNYSFTIPAGCIKSADGEEYAGDTFTFSVVGTFSLESYSPMETNKLEKIELTFSKEIVKVAMPNGGMMVADYYWTSMVKVKNDVVISEDKKTVTLELETPITTPGQYAMDLYQGVFLSEDGINEGAYMVFNVVDPTPAFITNYNEGDKVEEIKALEITFKNVKEVKLVEGAPSVVVYMPGGGEANGTPELADNKITVTFDQPLTAEGGYTFVIPEGLFTMDGVKNEEREINVTLATQKITPLEILSVTPAEENVELLDKIIIKFNQKIRLSLDENYQQISREIKLTCGDKEYTLTNDPGEGSGASDQLVYLVNAEWDGFKYASTPITEVGTYTLNLADIFVDYASEDYTDEWGYPDTKWHATNQPCTGSVSWAIVDSAIEGITIGQQGEQVIYDLLGRRIEKITGAGIYIVNGKKVVIK